MSKTKTLLIAGIITIAAYFIFSYAFPVPKAKTNFKPSYANVAKSFGKYPSVKFQGSWFSGFPVSGWKKKKVFGFGSRVYG